jgi:hypothetical protein
MPVFLEMRRLIDWLKKLLVYSRKELRMSQEVKRKAVLYKFSSTVIYCYDGAIYLSYFQNLNYFAYAKSKYHEMEVCDSMPGIVFNDCFWLPERDDEKAKGIFKEYFENKINSLKNQVRLQDTLFNNALKSDVIRKELN